MSRPRQLTITLDRSRNSRAFADDENLWVRELFRVLEMVKNHTASLRSIGPPMKHRTGGVLPQDQRPCLSIAIFGPSGSGKSSLLQTLEWHVNKQWFTEIERRFRRLDDDDHLADQDSPGLGRLVDRVRSLPVMQPDRFAEYDDFLYAFLASALKEEKEYRESQYEDEEKRRVAPDALSPVQQAFQDLSEFLRVIDEPEKAQGYDPLGLSLERLERHTSSLMLREKIKQFLETLADQLTGTRENSVVLLPVDDADMSPEHFVKTLKTYQSYLLHPRLVPVFTFTDRTAEETLRVYFKGHLSSPVTSAVDHRPEPLVFQEAGEGTQQLPVSEQLALQYLARCFPVRTRVRLGPAPARLREARYRHRAMAPPRVKKTRHGHDCECPECEQFRREQERREKESQAFKVESLLKAANQVLFGCPDRNARHELRTVLRPSTLRRQLHVVDEIVASGVESFSFYAPEDGATQGEFRETGKRWVDIYHRAVWSLMNVHRDVLREFDLYLEDLYSWTPQGLQRVVLDTLLQHELEIRRALLRRWQFRTDSRRGQTLSLLAANVFRPWMPGEEPYGDVSYARHYRPAKLERTYEGGSHITAMTATLWFLRLTIGFYLPQVLAENRPTDIARSRPDRGRIVGVGWDLRGGPVNAVLAAETENNHMATGMMFADPWCMAQALRVEEWTEKWMPWWVLRRDEDLRKEVEAYERVHQEIVEAADRLRAEEDGETDLRTLERELVHLEDIENRASASGLEIEGWHGSVAEAVIGSGASKEKADSKEDKSKEETSSKKEARAAKKEKDDAEAAGERPEIRADEFALLAHENLKSSLKLEKEEDLPGLPEPLDEVIRQTGKAFAQREGKDDERNAEMKGLIRCRASEGAILLRCWSYYGYGRGRYWAAVSFWRGLGLIGQLLELRRKHRQLAKPSEKLDDEKWAHTVRGALRSHLIRGMVPGELLGRIHGEDRLDLAFERWDKLDDQLRLRENGKERSEKEKNFLDRVLHWLDHDLNTLDEGNPDCSLLLRLVPGQSGKPYSESRWSRSLMRRLHGEDVVGDLMARINAAAIEDQGLYGIRGFSERGGRRVPRRYRWNAGIAMVSWTRMLLEYWRGLFPIQKLLRTCPLLSPFVNGPMLDDLRRELMDLTPGSVMTIKAEDWFEFSENGDEFTEKWSWERTDRENEASPLNLGAVVETLNEVAGRDGRLGEIFRRLSPELDHLKIDNVDEPQLDRYLRWLGLVDSEGNFEDWKKDPVNVELGALLRRQFCDVIRNAPALHLFHRVPRVLNKDFRPVDLDLPKYVRLSDE